MAGKCPETPGYLSQNLHTRPVPDWYNLSMSTIETGKRNSELDALIGKIPGGTAAALDRFLRAIEPWLAERVDIQTEGAKNPDAIREAAHEILIRMISNVNSGQITDWKTLSRIYVSTLDARAIMMEQEQPAETGVASDDVAAPDAKLPEAERLLKHKVEEALATLNPNQRFVLSERLKGRPMSTFHVTPERVRALEGRAAGKLSKVAAEMTGGDQQEIRARFSKAIVDARAKRGKRDKNERT
jgi:hypothetical protein